MKINAGDTELVTSPKETSTITFFSRPAEKQVSMFIKTKIKLKGERGAVLLDVKKSMLFTNINGMREVLCRFNYLRSKAALKSKGMKQQMFKSKSSHWLFIPVGSGATLDVFLDSVLIFLLLNLQPDEQLL